MAEQHRRYTFPPLERRGVLLGLQTGQLGTLLLGVAGALLVEPVAARTGRAPAWPSWCWPDRPGSPCGPDRDGRWSAGCRSPPAGSGGARRDATVASAAARRARAAGVERATGPSGHRSGRASSWSRPTVGPGDEPLGLVRDRRSGTWAAVVPVRGRSFVLLDGDAQVGQLEAWRAVLGTLARPGTPLRRLQWLHCSAPVASDRRRRSGRRPAALARCRRRRRRCRRIAGGRWPARATGSSSPMRGWSPRPTEAWLVLAVGGAQRPGRPGRHDPWTSCAARFACSRVSSATPTCRPDRPSTSTDLRALVGAAYRPSAGRPADRDRAGPWPMATDEAWSAYRADGAWHATFWIAEWPRVEVNPDFLTPLLLCDGRRTVSVVMAPVAAARAAREVRAARAADAADEELRSRAGFLPSVRRRREADG